MNKFSTWLNKNPGMATRLRKLLEAELGHSINPTCISNVKHDRRLMPAAWINLVANESDGYLSASYLLRHRGSVAKAKKRV